MLLPSVAYYVVKKLQEHKMRLDFKKYSTMYRTFPTLMKAYHTNTTLGSLFIILICIDIFNTLF